MLSLSLIFLFIPFVIGSRWNHLKEYRFSQTVDHFNFANAANFSQRSFIDDQHFQPGNPIFFYTGNEAPIETFINNTGILFEWAPHFNAMVVFCEHRFYGERSVRVLFSSIFL